MEQKRVLWKVFLFMRVTLGLVLCLFITISGGQKVDIPRVKTSCSVFPRSRCQPVYTILDVSA